MRISKPMLCAFLSLLLVISNTSSLPVAYAERHSPLLSQYTGFAIHGMTMLRTLLSQLNLNASYNEIDSRTAQKILGLIYSRGDLAMFTGSLQLRILKLYSGKGFLLSEEDVASALLAVAKSLGVNIDNISCDSAISKLIVNTYYDYEFCPYNVTDMDEFIDYVMYLGKNFSLSIATSVVSKLLILKLLYLNKVSVDPGLFFNLCNELLYNESLVTALFISSFTTYRMPKIMNSSASNTMTSTIKLLGESSNAVTSIESFEKLVYNTLLILERHAADNIRPSDILTAIFVTLSSNPSRILEIMNSSSITNVGYGGGAVGENPEWVEYHDNGAYVSQFIQNVIIEIDKNTSSHFSTGVVGQGTALKSSDSRQSDVHYTPAKEPRQRISISIEGFRRKTKVVEDVIAKSNAVMIMGMTSKNSNETMILHHVITIAGENTALNHELAALILLIPFTTVIIFRKRLFAILSRSTSTARRLLAESGKTKNSNPLYLDKRYLVLKKFWDIMTGLARGRGISLEACNTHREVLEGLKRSNIDGNAIKLIEKATLKYEIIRYAGRWEKEDLEFLNSMLIELEKRWLDNVR